MNVLDEAGKGLVGRLLSESGPLLVFVVWVALWIGVAHSDGSALPDAVAALSTDAGVVALVAVLVGVLLFVTAANFVNRTLAPVMLRWLEGYWPDGRITRRRVGHWQRRLTELSTRQANATPLGGIAADTDTAIVAQESTLAVRLRDFPDDRDDVLPTRIGNILRAGERRPLSRYGLDPIVLWPHMWLVLPEPARQTITEARSQLDTAVVSLVWSVVAIPVSMVAVGGATGYLAGALPLLLAVLIWRFWVPAAARTYSDYVSALFDVHRFLLYDAMDYARPPRPSAEPASGHAITAQVFRGSNGPATFSRAASPR